MAVQNRLHFRTFLHNRQVKEDFAGAFARPGDLVPVHIDDAEVFRFHEAFADLRRRADDAVFVDAVADVAVVRRRETFVVQPATHVADFFFNLMQIEHIGSFCF